MNLNLFLIIIIALIIIFCIMLYNGLRILLIVEKEKGIVKYEFKATMLKITIFKRMGTEGIFDSTEDSTNSEDEEEETSGEDSKPEDETGLREKYENIKPLLYELKKSKEELKIFLNSILKTIDLKRLEGNLILGLSDNTSTIKIASWIWSIGAIVNSEKSRLLTVEPKFTERVVDFEGKVELKINLLLLLIYSLILLTKKNIRELIRELYNQKESKEESVQWIGSSRA